VGNTWMTDARHLIDTPASAGPAFRLAVFFSMIVSAATSRPDHGGEPVDSDVGCRRRPGRRPCPGIIRVAIDRPSEHVQWMCTECNDEGVITNWRGTSWDKTSRLIGGVMLPLKRESVNPLAAPFIGSWRLTSTDVWGTETIHMMGPARIEFDGTRSGSLRFIAVIADLDCRFSEREGRPFVEFSFDGIDDGSRRGGRGWAHLEGDILAGRIFFHRGDESAFSATRQGSAASPATAHSGRASRVRVQLLEVDPPIWRTLEVPRAIRLDQLHEVLQHAMGWQNYHLYQFEAGGVRYSPPSDDDWDEPVDPSGVTLDRLLGSPGSKIVYEYDFGDGWRHELTLEEITDPPVSVRLPRCLAGARACPPEDVGGTFGYEEFVEAVSDPKNPEHDRMLTWCGGSFDPEKFDSTVVNALLSRIRFQPTWKRRSR
jgi:hypothetical protein